MFAILQYVVKQAIKPRNFSPVARQPALTWQAVYTQILVLGIKWYHSRMNRMWAINTELWHLLALYITCMCQCDLLLWPFFHKNWVTSPGCSGEYICLFESLYKFSLLNYSIINCRVCCPVARQPALPWQSLCASFVGVVLMFVPEFEVDVNTHNVVMAHYTCIYYMW